jgi:hypothetical protein
MSYNSSSVYYTPTYKIKGSYVVGLRFTAGGEGRIAVSRLFPHEKTDGERRTMLWVACASDRSSWGVCESFLEYTSGNKMPPNLPAPLADDSAAFVSLVKLFMRTPVTFQPINKSTSQPGSKKLGSRSAPGTGLWSHSDSDSESSSQSGSVSGSGSGSASRHTTGNGRGTKRSRRSLSDGPLAAAAAAAAAPPAAAASATNHLARPPLPPAHHHPPSTHNPSVLSDMPISGGLSGAGSSSNEPHLPLHNPYPPFQPPYHYPVQHPTYAAPPRAPSAHPSFVIQQPQPQQQLPYLDMALVKTKLLEYIERLPTRDLLCMVNLLFNPQSRE